MCRAQPAPKVMDLNFLRYRSNWRTRRVFGDPDPMRSNSLKKNEICFRCGIPENQQGTLYFTFSPNESPEWNVKGIYCKTLLCHLWLLTKENHPNILVLLETCTKASNALCILFKLSHVYPIIHGSSCDDSGTLLLLFGLIGVLL